MSRMKKAIDKRGWLFVFWLIWVGTSKIYLMGIGGAMLVGGVDVYAEVFGEDIPGLFWWLLGFVVFTLVSWWSLLRIWYFERKGFYIFVASHMASLFCLSIIYWKWWLLPGGIGWVVIMWLVIRSRWSQFR